MTTARPSLHINFAKAKRLPPQFTHTRNSAATYFDASGILRSAPNDAVRFNHDPATGECLGALLEVVGTNIALQSETIGTSPWVVTNCSTHSNEVVAPDGTTTGGRIHLSAGAAATVAHAFACTAAQHNAFAVFAKAGTTNWLRLEITETAALRYSAWFNLTTGTLGTVQAGLTRAKIEPAGNGWYRCHVSCDATITTSTATISVVSADNISTGDTGDNLYVWGAQIENNRYFGTSYIKTEAAAVTRNRDDLILLNSEYGNWMGAMSEGTVLLHFSRDNNFSNSGYGLAFTDNTPDVNNLIQLPFIYAGGLVVTRVNTGGSNQFSDDNQLLPSTTYEPRKMAFAFKRLDMARAFDGANLITDNTCDIPTAMDRFVVSYNQAYIGHIKEFMFWPTRLDNQTIQDLTLK
jgi:hypothetical protein